MSGSNIENVAIALQYCTAQELEDIASDFNLARGDLARWAERNTQKFIGPFKVETP
jgi:hypothetical protein